MVTWVTQEFLPPDIFQANLKKKKNLCWIISFLFELEAKSDLIVIRIS